MSNENISVPENPSAPTQPTPPVENLEVPTVAPTLPPEATNPPDPLYPSSGADKQGGTKPTLIRDLLMRAKEKIQWRKRKKLEKILVLAGQKGNITNQDVEKLLRVSDSTATRYLNQLVKEGRLIRQGKPKNAFYRLP